MSLSRKEKILSLALILTLLAGISMALCISLVMKPRIPASPYKPVASKDLSATEINVICNCSIPSLSYIFEPNQQNRIAREVSPRMKPFILKKYRAQVRYSENVSNFQELEEKSWKGDFSEILLSSVAFTTSTSVVAKPLDNLMVTKITINKNLRETDTMKIINNTDNAKRLKRNIVNEKHCFMPNMEEPKIIFDINKEIWKYHAYLVAILAHRYRDDMNDPYYLCSGVIIHVEYAVTGRNCVDNKAIDSLTIRSNSHYWSVNGSVHKILDVYYSDQLVALNVDPPFKTDNIRPLSFNFIDSSVTEATSAGWYTSISQKYAEYRITRWGSNCQRPHLTENSTCKNFLGHPMIDSNRIVVGLRACSNDVIVATKFQDLLSKLIKLNVTRVP